MIFFSLHLLEKRFNSTVSLIITTVSSVPAEYNGTHKFSRLRDLFHHVLFMYIHNTKQCDAKNNFCIVHCTPENVSRIHLYTFYVGISREMSVW